MKNLTPSKGQPQTTSIPNLSKYTINKLGLRLGLGLDLVLRQRNFRQNFTRNFPETFGTKD